MKKFIATIALALITILSVNAQNKMKKSNEIKTISLEQTKGEFTQKALTVSAGTYVFSVSNKSVGTDVGFVFVQKGKDATNPENHIKTAYVTSVVKEGKTENSNATNLAKGEYVYFCSLNKTPQYNLTVK
jgi:plastocyanin